MINLRKGQKNNFKREDAQTVLEYVILVGIVTIVLFFMTPLLKRAVQGFVRTVADQVGNQEAAEQSADESGYLVFQQSETYTDTDKRTTDRLGAFNYYYDDEIETDSITLLNLGFTERNF